MKASRLVSILAFAIACVLLRGARAVPHSIWPRAGVVVAGSIDARNMDLLGPVWYYNYGFMGTSLDGHPRALLVRPPFSYDLLAEAVRENPSHWWLLGNEPNDPHQDNLSPEAYAAFFQRASTLIRANDVSCRIAPAGIANADWQWAQAFRESYRVQYGRWPRVDAWNIHNYVLEPQLDQLDVAEFQRRILTFRDWMKSIGESGKPLLLTEFGALYGTGHLGRPPEDPVRVQSYIGTVVDWLSETEHVQAWAWFSSWTGGQFNGDLYTDEQSLTAFGESYRGALTQHAYGASDD